MATEPSSHVLAAFGAAEKPSPVPGGEGHTWRAGDVVLKPVVDDVEAGWVAEVCRAAEPRGFRLPRPLATTDGAWVSHGWSAWEWVPGEHRYDRWGEVLEVADHFHAAVADVSRPAWLDDRTHQWSIGDRAAWQEIDYRPAHAALAPIISSLLERLRPVDAPSQIIHGDLTGNVLFHDGIPPAVIDLSPYYRPTAFAKAIVIVDAVAWSGEPLTELIDEANIGDADQHVARATVFRLVAADVVSGARRDAFVENQVRAHQPVHPG